MTTKDVRQDLYATTRDDLLKRQLSNNENFDRAVLTLSSAALATSVAFLRGMPAENGISFLVLSWIAFVAAIVATLVSFLTSQAGIERQLELAEKYYLKENEASLTERNRPAEWTDRLAIASAIFFVLGIVLLLGFFGSNLPYTKQGTVMPEERPHSGEKSAREIHSEQILEGASIPRMQRQPEDDDLGAAIPPIQRVPEQRTETPAADSEANGSPTSAD